MTERITRREAETRINRNLQDYQTLDKQLATLTKQSGEIRRQQGKVKEEIDMLAKALHLGDQTITSDNSTYSLQYIQPRVALSQKLLQDTLQEFFQQHVQVRDPTQATQTFLKLLENKKHKLGKTKEKSLKIKYS